VLLGRGELVGHGDDAVELGVAPAHTTGAGGVLVQRGIGHRLLERSVLTTQRSQSLGSDPLAHQISRPVVPRSPCTDDDAGARPGRAPPSETLPISWCRACARISQSVAESQTTLPALLPLVPRSTSVR